MTKTPLLPDGTYPFIGERLPLSELAMIEVPISLRDLLVDQAKRNGVEIVRDRPVEINCVSDAFGTATFLIYWPAGENMHMLAPTKFQVGLA